MNPSHSARSVQPFRIAFTCTGNICRSPLAEALARHHLDASGQGDDVTLESFGTHDYHVGQGADHRTVATAQALGIDLSTHRARHIRAEDCERVDLVLAMDSGHERFLRRLAPAQAPSRIRLYLPFMEMDGESDVPDPYYGGHEDFLAVHHLLDRAARRLVARLPAIRAERDVR